MICLCASVSGSPIFFLSLHPSPPPPPPAHSKQDVLLPRALRGPASRALAALAGPPALAEALPAPLASAARSGGD